MHCVLSKNSTRDGGCKAPKAAYTARAPYTAECWRTSVNNLGFLKMFVNNQNKTQKQLQSRLRSSPAPVMGAHIFLQTKFNEIIEYTDEQ